MECFSLLNPENYCSLLVFDERTKEKRNFKIDEKNNYICIHVTTIQQQ